MELTIEHWTQLVKMLREHGDLRAQLGILILGEEIPRALTALAEAQRGTEHRLQELTLRVDGLAQQVGALASVVEGLTEAVKGLTDQVGELRGESMERRYREHAAAYFGRFLRGLRVVDVQNVEDRLEGGLAPQELEDLFNLDLVVSGRSRVAPESDVWLAIEISSMIDRGDVERARRRAALLRRSGLKVVAAVAGKALTEGARDEARRQAVAVFEDGRAENWDDALATQA